MCLQIQGASFYLGIWWQPTCYWVSSLFQVSCLFSYLENYFNTLKSELDIETKPAWQSLKNSADRVSFSNCSYLDRKFKCFRDVEKTSKQHLFARFALPQFVDHRSDFAGVWADCTKPVVLLITTPKKMEALSGSCLQIPCNFSAKLTQQQQFDSRRETFGVWIKSDHRFGKDLRNVIFNSSETVQMYPMVFTGNLTEKNCTTLFSSLRPSYTDTYFFRIENKPFMGTASCDPLQITVQGKRGLLISKHHGLYLYCDTKLLHYILYFWHCY